MNDNEKNEVVSDQSNIEPTNKGKWILNHGIHKGTLMSRDTDRSEHNSMEECRASLAEQEKFYRRFGYMIWFADVIAPDGTKTTIHPGNPYY